MNRAGWLACAGALVVTLPVGWSEPLPAPDPTESTTAATPPVATAPARVNGVVPSAENGLVQMRFGPAVSKSRRLKAKLKAAFLTALDRVRRGAECRALFAPLEADGVDMLTRSIYARASAGMEATWCRHSVAGTNVGNRTVFLCRRFATLPVEEAATILIHEAMHWAGMSENHLEQSSPTGDQISSMVRRACFLFDRANEIRVARVEPDRVEDSAPKRPVETMMGAVPASRASSILTTGATSRFNDIVDMRSSSPY
jgi:hypothetical protein